VSLLVSFFLQKHWTFKNKSYDRVHVQATQYFVLQMANLACNLMLLYMFVEYLHIWYLLSQMIIALGLAIGTFLLARKYIF
jgi:putative flippase GtrA